MFIRHRNSNGLYGNIDPVGSPTNPVVIAPGSDNIAEKPPAKNEKQANGITGDNGDLIAMVGAAILVYYLL